MCATDATAAVADHDDHLELRIGQLDASGVGDAAPVQPMESIGNEILVAEPLAADIGNDYHLSGIQGEPDQCLVEGVQDQAVAAARAERVGALVAVSRKCS